MSGLRRLRFADFEVDLATGELWRGAEHVRIQDLPFRLLAALLERPGELVTRADLNQRLWGTETFVDVDAGVNTAVAKLREALNDSADAPRFIETVPKRGYRFLAPVDVIQADPAAPIEPTGPAPIASPIARVPPPRRPRATIVAATLAGVLVIIVGLAWFKIAHATPAQTRVAVALFDNETGQTSFDRLAQTLTDSTVASLTSQKALAVIGNAAVLRTSRPFRDLLAIREALHADFIVIGQVQTVDGAVTVRTHLIRASDQAHVWVQATPLTAAGEATLEAAVTGRVSAAVAKATARHP